MRYFWWFVFLGEIFGGMRLYFHFLQPFSKDNPFSDNGRPKRYGPPPMPEPEKFKRPIHY